jgi:competence protein ComEC
MILYYSLLFFGTSELFFILRKRKKHKGILIGMMVLFCIGFYVQWSTANVFNKADLIFVDVGQGDCLHLKTEEGKNILIDGGGSANRDVGEDILMPYLLKNGVSKIDAAFVTHLHQDHYGGIASLARKGMIRKLILYEGNKVRENDILTETGLTKEQLVYVTKGNTVQLGKKSTVVVLWPFGSGSDEALRPDHEAFEREEEDENKNSLILMVDHHGLTVLMTGDIDTNGEELLMDSSPYKEWLKSDLLKISHHGSRYSSSEPFLQAVDPLVSVIQVGKNTFGHPHSSILDRLDSLRIPLYRNDLRGAIGFSRVPEVPAVQGIRVYTMH